MADESKLPETHKSPELASEADSEDLPTTASELDCDGVRIILIGTAHVSRSSLDDVRKVIAAVKPNAVFLELCSARRQMLAMDPDRPLQNNREFSMSEVQKELNEGRGVSGVLGLAIASFTAQVADQLNMEIPPGAEFAAAAQAAHAMNAGIFLGDRDVNVTLKRAMASLSFWEKLKLVYQFAFSDLGDLSEEDIENLKNSDLLTTIVEDLGREFPNVLEPLLYERDRYMRHTLRKSCEILKTKCEPGIPLTMVAVVGMGHKAGIIKDFHKEPDAEDFARISAAPKGSRVTFFRVVVVGSGIAVGLFVFRSRLQSFKLQNLKLPSLAFWK